MLDGLAAVGVGLVVLVLALVWPNKKKQTLESKIAAYTRPTHSRAAKPTNAQSGLANQAVDVAQKALKSNAGFEEKLSKRLDGADISLKPAEWLLLHAAAVLVLAALGALFMGVVGVVVGVVAGLLLPWLYLGFKRSRRLKAFGAQLADTLQLMAGSLQAGLSFTQSIDTVVREGEDPIASEFRRALVETRLGVPMEDALEPIAERMESEDFKWTVMAVRIQREVGGNLAELLLQVAATLRERDYLRRQVKALSAEGRFSAYILLALPPCLIGYMFMANREYLRPLYTTSLGYVMLVVMVVLMGIGSFSMKKIIKLDV
jgi:tight adherence protein B